MFYVYYTAWISSSACRACRWHGGHGHVCPERCRHVAQPVDAPQLRRLGGAHWPAARRTLICRKLKCVRVCVWRQHFARIIMNKICSISVCCCDCGTIVAVSYNSNDCSAKCCTYCRLLNKRWIENWRVYMQHCSDVMIRVCRFILLVTRLKKDRLHFVLLMTPASGHKNQTPNVKDLHTTLFSRRF